MDEKQNPCIDGDMRAASLIARCLHGLPLSWRKRIFTALAMLHYRFVQRHRLIAFHNLQRAFPEKSMADIAAIAKGVYRNMAVVGAELFDLPWLTRENLTGLVEVEGLEHCQGALERGKGILFFSGHFGNWELSAVAVSLLLSPMIVLYRPLDNPLLDKLIYFIRSSTGNRPLRKERAMRQILRALQKNMIVGILMDQNVAWREGVFVDFFSHPACTTDGLAQLALRTQAAVLPLFLLRKPNGTYRLILGREMEIVDTGDSERDAVANTQRFTSVLEEMVRQYPDQWLWVHNRWKTKKWQGDR